MRQKKKWNCVAVTTSASADPVRISVLPVAMKTQGADASGVPGVGST